MRMNGNVRAWCLPTAVRLNRRYSLNTGRCVFVLWASKGSGGGEGAQIGNGQSGGGVTRQVVTGHARQRSRLLHIVETFSELGCGGCGWWFVVRSTGEFAED